MFGCTPKEALEQDPVLVDLIAEYRVARAAVNAMNDGERGQRRLAESPALGAMLDQMARAQQED